MSITGQELFKIHLYGILAWLTDFLILRYFGQFQDPQEELVYRKEKKQEKNKTVAENWVSKQSFFVLILITA